MAVNGLYIVQGEANAVVAVLKKAHRGWSQQQIHHAHSSFHESDPLLRNFTDLRDVLNSVNELSDMNPNTFLSPFLDVIKSEQTNGLVTAQALSSVAKFLSYGLIDSMSIKASTAVENIANAVTRAKFVGGSNSSSDEVVLMKILQVLRTLLLTPVGAMLSNESVCEMMQSSFRICFEPALSELLRKTAESTLSDMTQLLFTRLPSFTEDLRHPYIRKLVKRAGGLRGRRKRCRATTKNISRIVAEEQLEEVSEDCTLVDNEQKNISVEPVQETGHKSEKTEVLGDIIEVSQIEEETMNFQSMNELAEKEKLMSKEPEKESNTEILSNINGSLSSAERLPEEIDDVREICLDLATQPDESDGAIADSDESSSNSVSSNILAAQRTQEKIDRKEAHYLQQIHSPTETLPLRSTSCIPYGLPSARELLRFLIALTNPLDRANNESMIIMALNLLTVALEAGADHWNNYSLLIPLVKNELCRALLQLLDTEKLPIFAAANRVCFLLFESMRTALKFQMESYFLKLKAIVTSEQSRISYEKKEMALESIVELWRIPGLVTEIYFNYDCDLYCSNLFEDLTKLLLENAFPMVGLHSLHILSLDALLTVIDTIDMNCIYRQAGVVNRSLVLNSTSASVKLSLPAISGFAFGKEMDILTDKIDLQAVDTETDIDGAIRESLLPSSAVRANRMTPSKNLPFSSEIVERKKKKRIVTEATDLFNQDPKKGIEYLREKGILKYPVDPVEIVSWLRENPRLDKKRIADYICNRKNSAVLDIFVRSFPFESTRLDDALRIFLETFRLPGEAAEISMVMQHFADHWHKANSEPFNHVDAAFTLAYAIIMLNTDQHNPQVRRNQPPMQLECFKRNLSGTNGGQDFDADMLEQIYNAIRSDEIVMPAEQVGIVRENYLWKVLLRRGETKEGEFIHIPAGWNDRDLFGIIWGPASAALSFVFDKSEKESILQKSLNGYRKCASIAAHYGMSDVFDNLIIHLCKFSTLMTLTESNADQKLESQYLVSGETRAQSAEQIAQAFGENIKAQMAAKAMFQLVHTHGDILREGWKNVLDCILCLFQANLLPKQLVEVEDFVDSKGWVSILRPRVQKMSNVRTDSGLLSWFGLTGSNHETREHKLNADQEQSIKVAKSVIEDCHLEQVIIDGKYLTASALTEFINAIMQSSTAISGHLDGVKSTNSFKKLNEQDEDALILFLELAVSITLENKDRLSIIWPLIKQHIQWILLKFGHNPLVVERAVTGLLRLANRNLFRLKDEIANEVLHSLNMLLDLSSPALFLFSRHIAFGLHELLRANAANVHHREHWSILFALLEAVGAGAYPEDRNPQFPQRVNIVEREIQSDDGRIVSSKSMLLLNTVPFPLATDKGYTSDGPQAIYARTQTTGSMNSLTRVTTSSEWIHIDHKDVNTTELKDSKENINRARIFDRGTVVLRTDLARHEPAAYLKVGETLGFLVRDAAHITPENFDSCVHCLRSYVEASLDGGRYAAGPMSGDAQNQFHSIVQEKNKQTGKTNLRKKLSVTSSFNEDEETPLGSEMQQLSASYQQTAFQMLDLCHTLHVKAAGIYKSWAEGGADVDASTASIWVRCWRPLLQCIVRLCCDCRRQVRTQAFNYLVRAFLISEMQNMSATDWENCFSEILFPLINKLLENLSPMDPLGMEETRIRGIQLVSKILLNHLNPLSQLTSFSELWLRLLEFMDCYLHTDRSDLLSEAIPESLKNMILVLDNTKIFEAIPGLFELTKKRVSTILPDLLHEILPNLPKDTIAFLPNSSIERIKSQEILPPAPLSQKNLVISSDSGECSSSRSDLLQRTSCVGSITHSVDKFAAGLNIPVQIAPPIDLQTPVKRPNIFVDNNSPTNRQEVNYELEGIVIHSDGKYAQHGFISQGIQVSQQSTVWNPASPIASNTQHSLQVSQSCIQSYTHVQTPTHHDYSLRKPFIYPYQSEAQGQLLIRPTQSASNSEIMPTHLLQSQENVSSEAASGKNVVVTTDPTKSEISVALPDPAHSEFMDKAV